MATWVRHSEGTTNIYQSFKTKPTCAKNDRNVDERKQSVTIFSAIGNHLLNNPDCAANQGFHNWSFCKSKVVNAVVSYT